MDINIRERDGVVIFDIQGKIIGFESLNLKYAIETQVATRPEGEVRILLNLGKVPIVDASGLGAIVAAHTSVQRKKGRIALLCPRRIKNLLRATRLIITFKGFERFENEDEAIAAMNQ